jgi:hypothetical protein
MTVDLSCYLSLMRPTTCSIVVYQRVREKSGHENATLPVAPVSMDTWIDNAR